MGLRNPPPSYRVFSVVCVIVFGVMLASFGELKFALAGFLIQMAAVMFEAYKNALQQSLLGGKMNMSSMTLLYYFAPICTIFNFFFIVFFELDGLMRWHTQVADPREAGTDLNLWILLLNGALTFSLNIASVNVVSNSSHVFISTYAEVLCQIKQTSSLVLTLAGIPKAIMLMVLDMILYQSPMSKIQAIGFTIAGFGTYQYSRLKESAKNNGSKGMTVVADQDEELIDEEAQLSEKRLEYNEKGEYVY